ncbi:Serine/threonine-protein phosphatase [Mycena kentingensis (nom. inval.)]|nr:Serine/threonine-protein phosphatase [Mycena kentingensis (nom. inval.)]
MSTYENLRADIHRGVETIRFSETANVEATKRVEYLNIVANKTGGLVFELDAIMSGGDENKGLIQDLFFLRKSMEQVYNKNNRPNANFPASYEIDSRRCRLNLAPPAMSSLPGELADIIIDLVAANDDRQTLAACALVSRIWVPRSRYHLFASIWLIRHHGKDTVNSFFQLFRQRRLETISNSIRRVCIVYRASYGTPVLSLGDILTRVIGFGIRPLQLALDCHISQLTPPPHSPDLSSVQRLELDLIGERVGSIRVAPIATVFPYLESYPGMASLAFRMEDPMSNPLRLAPEPPTLDVTRLNIPENLHELDVHPQCLFVGSIPEALHHRFTSISLHLGGSSSSTATAGFSWVEDVNAFLRQPLAAQSITSLVFDNLASTGAQRINISTLSALTHLQINQISASTPVILFRNSADPFPNLETFRLGMQKPTPPTDERLWTEADRQFANNERFPRLKRVVFLQLGVPKLSEGGMKAPRSCCLGTNMQSWFKEHLPLCAAKGMLGFDPEDLCLNLTSEG